MIWKRLKMNGQNIYLRQMENNQQQIHQANPYVRIHSLTQEEMEEAVKEGQKDERKNEEKQKKLKICCLREGCEDINNYKSLNRIHQGTYGVVFRAQQVPTNKIFAVKKLKLKQGSDFPITSLRQISILRSLDHPNIIKITRVAGSPEKDKVYIVMQYLDHELKQLLRIVKFKEPEMRRIMRDLLEGIEYLHQRKIVHRDLKPSNLLYSNQGILKICDFGLARKASQALMTQQVATMFYRPPELLLGEYKYSTQLDMWSIGCIMAQIVLNEPPFRGKTELEQLDLIFKSIGSPKETQWPEVKLMKNYMYIQGRKYPYRLGQLFQKGQQNNLSPQGIDLLKMMLSGNPKTRITAKKALTHPWFKGQICSREKMPKRKPINQEDRKNKKVKPNEGIEIN